MYSVSTPEGQAQLLAAWKDAPIHNLDLCAMLLLVAAEQVYEYAPSPYEQETAEENGYRLTTAQGQAARYAWAQLQQAKNLWNAGRVAPNGESGADGFSFAPRPLDKEIRRIIRPMGGVPNVF